MTEKPSLATLGLIAYWLAFRLPPRANLSASVWFLAYGGPLLLLPVLPFVVWLFLFVGARQARPFRGQNVDISPLGLVFNGENRLEISWPQIEGWHWIRKRHVRFLQVQTARGIIEIPNFIAGFRALCRILERFSGASLVKIQSEEEMAVHPVQTAPDGTLIFRFYGVSVRIVTWSFIPLGATMALTMFLMRLVDPQNPLLDSTSVLWVAIAASLGGLFLEWWMRAAKLCLTPEFLEWRVPFKNRQIAWKEIESFGSSPNQSGWIQVAGEKISLSLFWSPIEQRSRLHAEIEKRAPNAKGSWQ